MFTEERKKKNAGYIDMIFITRETFTIGNYYKYSHTRNKLIQ